MRRQLMIAIRTARQLADHYETCAASEESRFALGIARIIGAPTRHLREAVAYLDQDMPGHAVHALDEAAAAVTQDYRALLRHMRTQVINKE